MLYLNDSVGFNYLTQLGFEEDPFNCDDVGDHYYSENNWFYKCGDDFRIVINMHSRMIEILCLADEKGLFQLMILEPLYELITEGLVIDR